MTPTHLPHPARPGSGAAREAGLGGGGGSCGTEPETAVCPECGGSGEVLGGYVTRDMAKDAGEPDMEGMPVPMRCPTCDGNGDVYLDP